MSNSVDDDPSDSVCNPDENTRSASSLDKTHDERTDAEPRGLARKNTTRASALDNLQSTLPRKAVDLYVDVLKQLADDDTPDLADPDAERYNSTQNGVVVWNPQEKGVLYRSLDRKGREGIREVARRLGSKSEIEVQEHLRLLQNGLQKRHMTQSHSRTIILADVPAAAEIGNECHRTLDHYAELLRLKEQQDEDVTGRHKHRDFWVIDYEKALDLDHRAKTEKADRRARADDPDHRLAEDENPANQEAENINGHGAQDLETGTRDEQLHTPDRDVYDRSSVHLTASLFKMSNWVNLSERFFMNSGGTRSDENWRGLSFADETPSLTADAFADFYSLAVSLTRRLVQSSLFFADARLRKVEEDGRARARDVRARDVRTALDVLNMKRENSDFWVGLARRLSLDVVDNRHVKGWKSIQMDYDEVEDILSRKQPLPSQSGSIARSVSRGRDGSQVVDDQGSDAGNESEPPISGQAVSPEPIEEVPFDSEDEYAEQVDREASRAEESNLWELVGRSPPPTPSYGHAETEGQNEKDPRQMKPDPRKRPISVRKSMDDLFDWRDRLLYRSEWEEYGHDAFDLQDEILENRNKRRRLEQGHMQSFLSGSAGVDASGGNTDVQYDISPPGSSPGKVHEVDSMVLDDETMHEEQGVGSVLGS
ncbi:uncharacterized protein BO95DRAFT_445723 [Aspergillus brunneoviolaceus CBS 621.78]|uniref:Uncharacterized protein n=1 Tax=Aspergillus brunneoviolaceus CBS 621.78 TaxID=1450534 RepID=A0ACD1G0X3_9EURO|nr:hypothetical protein BO95DRAFT_445723 [Aspergillus brunneoviolaceus CBS 621.78]RAH42813.1 hypothetical protein BO95DRAFT_445723 [Aspergillus brunneoviolaceus CBS 621.78]